MPVSHGRHGPLANLSSSPIFFGEVLYRYYLSRGFAYDYFSGLGCLSGVTKNIQLTQCVAALTQKRQHAMAYCIAGQGGRLLTSFTATADRAERFRAKALYLHESLFGSHEIRLCPVSFADPTDFD